MSQSDAFFSELQMREQRVRVCEEEERIAAAAHDKSTTALMEAVDLYNTMRRALIMQEIISRGVSWCTRCKETAPVQDLSLVLHEGTEELSGGYQGGDCYFEDFKYLYRACATCREQMYAKHGWTGRKDVVTGQQAKSHTFMVEKREDGYYENKLGTWRKIVPKNKWDKPLEIPITMPDYMVEELATEWQLPLALKIQWGNHGSQIVVPVPPTLPKDPNAIPF